MSGSEGRSSGGRGSGGRGSSGRGSGARGGAKGGPRGAQAKKSSRPARRPRAQAPVPEVAADVHVEDGVRLQKVLAQAGVGSRRACEALIAAGRVQVDGHVVVEQGVRIDPSRQVVHVDGVRVQVDDDKLYLAFNKPAGVVSTMSDDLGRVSLGDFMADRPERLFHVGRLDSETEGLILLTNDGDLAHRLQHPAFGVQKTYLAEVPGPVARDVGRRLRDGVELDDGPVRVDSFRLVDSQPGKALVEVVLHEGRKHVVRRALEEVGHPVERLVRVQVGPIHLGDLRQGRWRVLTRTEVGQLFSAAGL
ncbi:pseudouridine synthase [Angustibacter peucedani]